MNKILILANHRKDRSPGQRFRFEQYIDFLDQNGFECELSYLLSERDDKSFYSKGKWISKFFIVLKCFFMRLKNVNRAENYDIVFVFREAFFTGTTFFEKKFAKKSKVVFDFDDSIWLANVSDGNKKLEWLKNYNKTSEIIEVADLIIAGNPYLSNYAKQYNKNVKIIPTTIDTLEYSRLSTKQTDTICIGWSGSVTTIQHFNVALPFLIKLKDKYGDKICFKVIGDNNYINEELNIQGIAWNKEDEIKELSSFDIGIMPLPNDKWAEGKCGLKGLQYMALEIPTIMSPVGVNIEIIQDGENGFLADKEDEWLEKLSLLIENEKLRNTIGKAGRKTVEEKYSVQANKDKYLRIFNSLV